jgi:hypothetical protein
MVPVRIGAWAAADQPTLQDMAEGEGYLTD